MLILSRVCAEFHDKSGQTIFSVTPEKLLSFLEAPEAIQEDPLFTLMLRDGSLEAVRSVEQKRNLESDPVAGANPEGKKNTRKTTAEDAGTSASDVAAAVDDSLAVAGIDVSAADAPASSAMKTSPAADEAAAAAPASQGTSGKTTRKSGRQS